METLYVQHAPPPLYRNAIFKAILLTYKSVLICIFLHYWVHCNSDLHASNTCCPSLLYWNHIIFARYLYLDECSLKQKAMRKHLVLTGSESQLSSSAISFL